MSINNPFALNHILAPNLNIHDFFKLAKNLNIQNIEIRNDLPKISLYNINAKIILSKKIKSLLMRIIIK